MAARISHIVIKVSDVRKSGKFYGILAGYLGLKRIYSDGKGFGYWNDSFSIWATCAARKNRLKRGDVGYDHIALTATSRKQVDGLQRLLKRNRYRILYPAAEHTEYAPGYYSVSFCAPEGTVIELLHLPKSENAYG